MRTVGEFLTDCGRRLAPFERLRVGKVGCVVALSAIVVAAGAIALGMKDTAGSWGSGFRFVVLVALGSVIALFVAYAAVETMVERSVRAAIERYLREGGADRETLVKAAELRSGSIPGGRRLAQLLKDPPG